MTSEAFPPYLQPEAIFMEGLDQVEMVEPVNGDGSLAASHLFQSKGRRSI